jgi:DNA-binding NtrC family response regulator
LAAIRPAPRFDFGNYHALDLAMPNTLVVLSDLPMQSDSLCSLSWKFGWQLVSAASLEELRELRREHSIVAILFDPKALHASWRQALYSVLDAAPESRPIICHSFSEEIPWPEMAAAGAFHSLKFPFDYREVQQSLGFVWASAVQRRSAALSESPHLSASRAVA